MRGGAGRAGDQAEAGGAHRRALELAEAMDDAGAAGVAAQSLAGLAGL